MFNSMTLDCCKQTNLMSRDQCLKIRWKKSFIRGNVDIWSNHNCNDSNTRNSRWTWHHNQPYINNAQWCRYSSGTDLKTECRIAIVWYAPVNRYVFLQRFTWTQTLQSLSWQREVFQISQEFVAEPTKAQLELLEVLGLRLEHCHRISTLCLFRI